MFYASVFLYQPRLKIEYVGYNPSIQSYEASQMLPNGSSAKFKEFMDMSDEQQRTTISDKNKAEEYIRLFFEIVKKVKGDVKLVNYALMLIDGILEDSRARIQYLVNIQRSHKKEKKEDLIGVLNSFLWQNNQSETLQRDLASHILAMLIEAHEYKNCSIEAKQFMNWLIEQKQNPNVNINAYTFALMYLLKTNELAKEFVDQGGFELFHRYLNNECLKSNQIAYNVIASLWIISYHQFAYKGFEDYRLEIIERVAKVLDYFSKEKIVRIILLLFDNIKNNEVCLEILSDINCVNIVTKLQNRHWVDKDINDLLEKLFDHLDKNYKTFSSIDKFRKEVNKKSLRWGPVHTEKFWQENFIYFHEKENLDMIKVLVELLEHPDDRVKSIACFDLGEFARFFPFGRQYLDTLNLKVKIITLMQVQSSPAELKKEAITCYQKLLMTSWNSNEFK